MRVFLRSILIVVLPLAAFGPTRAQSEALPSPGDLSKLVSAVERLVNVLEQEAKARVESQSVEKIHVLVSILSIRHQQTDELESVISGADSEAENVRSELTTIKARLDTLGPTGRSPEESSSAEERTARKFLESQAKAQEEHLARIEERKLLAQSELASSRKRLARLESVLEDWVQKQY